MTASTRVVEPIDYAERWRRMVEERRVHMDALYARLGRDTSNFWAGRSDYFRPSARRQVGPDPFLGFVMERVTPRTTVLDVGAGGGRMAVPLAERAREVVAVEPAGPMVEVLREECALAGVANLRIVPSDWLAAEVEPADVVICSHVIYPIADVAPFLQKLDAMTRGTCLLYLNAAQPPWEYHELWTRFHKEPMRPQPTYIDAYNLLHQLGIYANVRMETITRWTSMQSPTFEAAAERMRDTLILDETPETTERLHAMLREVLTETGEGWSMPARIMPVAIIWWEKNRPTT